jgi:hypothetical protein
MTHARIVQKMHFALAKPAAYIARHHRGEGLAARLPPQRRQGAQECKAAITGVRE